MRRVLIISGPWPGSSGFTVLAIVWRIRKTGETD
jgi:hypothetical protein